MKKVGYLFFTTFNIFTAFTQAPANYYSNATGSGYALKTQLKNIITNNHNQLTYANLWDLYSSNDTNNGFKDQYYENDYSILDLYSEKPTAQDPHIFTPVSDQCGNYTNEGDCYNREHLIPQSYFDEQFPMKSDAFHVWPSDGKVNNNRGNLAFGPVATANLTSQNGTKRGTSAVLGFSGVLVEPIDEFKGDVARAFFYFVTRYEDLLDDFYTNNTTVEARVMFDGSTTKAFNTNFLNVLYQWHVQDPVSQREFDLNNFIYTQQGNRNPYIDNQQYVYDVWYQNLSNKNEAEIVLCKIYPNPANQNTINIYSKHEIDFFSIISFDGKFIKKVTSPVLSNSVYQINNLQTGFYLLVFSSNRKIGSQTFIVK